MREILAKDVKYLREIVGCGLLEAKKALTWAEGDPLLAEGYLKYQGLAVTIRREGMTDQEAYDWWVRKNAERYRKDVIEGRLPPLSVVVENLKNQ